MRTHCVVSTNAGIDPSLYVRQRVVRRGSRTPQSDEANPDEDYLRQDVAVQVQRALSRLPERDQAIARLHYYEHKTFKEIGDILGVTESRISQLHTRLKKRLIESLAAEETEAEASD